MASNRLLLFLVALAGVSVELANALGFTPPSLLLGFTHQPYKNVRRVMSPTSADRFEARSAPSKFFKSTRRTSPLSMGLFDFQPFAGGGSGKSELDEQWEAQQEILRARQGQFTKDALQEKYKPKAEVEETPVSMQATMEEEDDVGSAEEEPSPAKKNPFFMDMKLPWES